MFKYRNNSFFFEKEYRNNSEIFTFQHNFLKKQFID